MGCWGIHGMGLLVSALACKHGTESSQGDDQKECASRCNGQQLGPDNVNAGTTVQHRLSQFDELGGRRNLNQILNAQGMLSTGVAAPDNR